MQGTPKTLKEAIANGLCIGPLKDIHNNVHAHVVDFLRQKFGVAFLRAGNDQELLNALHALGGMIGLNEKIEPGRPMTTAQEDRFKRLFEDVG